MSTTNGRSLVRRLIRAHAPDVRARRLRQMPHPGWGGDSDAWLVDERWIFRFPRTAEIVRRLAVEACLLPRLAPRLPLAVPAFRYVVRDDRGDPAFVGYPAIPGAPLRRDDLTAAAPDVAAGLAEQLGRFLGALHRTPLVEAMACGVAPPAEDARRDLERRYARVQALAFPILTSDERDWVGRRFEGFLADHRHFAYTTVLCHGDFGSDHILWDADHGVLTGVIDFGDVGIGDPSGEFTWRAEYGEAFFRQALRAYDGPPDDDLPERTAFRIDCLPLSEICYGVEIGQEDYVEEGHRELRMRMAGGSPMEGQSR